MYNNSERRKQVMLIIAVFPAIGGPYGDLQEMLSLLSSDVKVTDNLDDVLVPGVARVLIIMGAKHNGEKVNPQVAYQIIKKAKRRMKIIVIDSVKWDVPNQIRFMSGRSQVAVLRTALGSMSKEK
jgi:hypothetical protein